MLGYWENFGRIQTFFGYIQLARKSFKISTTSRRRKRRRRRVLSVHGSSSDYEPQPFVKGDFVHFIGSC